MNWQTIVQQNNLDVTSINLSKLERDRIDAEFYSLDYLENEKALNELSTARLSDICQIKSGATPRDRDDNLTDGVILLKTTDIRNKPLSDNLDYYHISEEINQRMKSTELQEGDVLINIVGATLGVIGRISVVPKSFPKANITQAMALIRTANKTKFLSGYVFTFLLSQYGNLQAKRLARPTGQYNLNLQEVSTIKIVTASLKIQNEVEKLILKYLDTTSTLERLYSQAEQLLLADLNLTDYTPIDTNTSTRDLVDCLADDRFDAEYWQPKYDEIEIKTSGIPQVPLSEIVTIKKGIEIGSEAYEEEGENFVRVADFSIFGIEAVEKKLSVELFESLKDNYRPKKGEVLFTKDGTIGISYALNEDIEAIVSGAFLRFKPNDKINNNYLALVLNSMYCKAQIERMSGGAIIAHLKPDSAMQIKIPMLARARQDELANMVLEAFKMRKEAHDLLEKAKRAVEISIEQDEAFALAYLN